MGQDAVIVVDDRYYVLDYAWHYLLFDSGDSMTRHDALIKIKEFRKNALNDFVDEQKEDPEKYFIVDQKYYDIALYWFAIAENIIKSAIIDNVTFYPYNCDECCNGCPGKVGITDTHRKMDTKDIYKELK